MYLTMLLQEVKPCLRPCARVSVSEGGDERCSEAGNTSERIQARSDAGAALSYCWPPRAC